MARAVPMHVLFFFLALTLARTIPLEDGVHHVQGIVVDGPRLWVTSVDRIARRGWLTEYELETGKRIRAVQVQQGEMYHPGGFDHDEESLWIPVAEYRPGGQTVIQRLSKQTLEILSSFAVADHIGALAVLPDGLLAANWDARRFLLFTREGRLVWSRANPHAARYQDMKRRYGSIVAAGLLGKGEAARAVVDWLDPDTLMLLNRETLGRTDRGVPFTQEGMDYRDGRLYLLPEDAPSRLFVFRAEN
jgi:hypothetical protein